MSNQEIAERDNQIIITFMSALENRNFPAMKATLSAQLVYQNMPWPALDFNGTGDFYADFFPQLDSYRVDVLTQQSTAGMVSNERMEYFYYTHLNGGCIELPVGGFFKLDDAGMIIEWRDYFDLTTWVDQGGQILT